MQIESKDKLAKTDKRVTVYLTEAEYEAFKSALKKHGRYHSMSDAIRDFIRDFVDEQGVTVARPVEHPEKKVVLEAEQQ